MDEADVEEKRRDDVDGGIGGWVLLIVSDEETFWGFRRGFFGWRGNAWIELISSSSDAMMERFIVWCCALALL